MPRGTSPLDAAALQGRLWTPRNAGGDLRFWHQADALDTLTLDGSARVSEWRDIAGTGRNWAQGTAGSRPLFVPGGWDGVRPSIYTDGASRSLRMTVSAISQPFIVVLVARRQSLTTNAHWIDGAAGGSRIIVGGHDNVTTIIFAGSVLNGIAVNTNANVFCGIYNGSSSSNIVNGSVITTGNAGSHTWSDQWFMTVFQGGTWPSNGDVFSIAMVAGSSRALADRLIGYSAWAAGLQSRLAASHPFRNAPPLIGG